MLQSGRLWRTAFLGAFLLAGTAVGQQAQDDEPIPIGSRVPRFTFTDIRYLPRTLDDFGPQQAYVIVFTSIDCPIVQRYLPRLRELEAAYRERGVQFLALNTGTHDTVLQVAHQAIEADVPFPVGKDFDGSAARALGARRTPEVVVLDAQRRVRYRGRIDDQVRFGGLRPAPRRHDLREALEEVLAGKQVSVPETPVDGCLISFPSQAPPRRAVTYHEHIAPLLQKHCQECHRPGTAAPFPLLTYRDAAAHADTIAEVVVQGRMPPFFAVSREHRILNDRTLTPHERETFAAWVRGGLLEGDPAAAPPPRVFDDEPWRIGNPDLIVKMPIPMKIPASGFVDYKYVLLPYLFTRDTWVQRVEVKPGNPSVVHHCNVAFVRLGLDNGEHNLITGYVPGGDPMILSDHVGFLIPAWSTLILQVHYVTNGQATEDQTSVGFVFARERIDKRLRHFLIHTQKIHIPPQAPHHPLVESRTMPCDAHLYGLFTHMHLRGKAMTFRAIEPGGAQRTLLCVPNYSFDWQLAYHLERGKVFLPSGTRIQCTAYYDNSPFNPYNPDPDANVRHGPQTPDEMMHGFVFYVDAQEQLGLHIDPKTGHVVPAEQPPARPTP
jgi:peroxiredoxin